ncbi:3-deoxy-manno-octulosonate cytidylyltransferase [Candidatus Micrarchaeota archaeon]|nr:3-deoxy-manno-octulosonate cytidylyltransferase [Candidatus Micrarchaeota archaeon]MBU1681404.1 3-deoxy-manno-octulosonate cytidylyltransferase [Candidatus Micrarchaeota archaeon]
MKVIGVIPARLKSNRLPEKPLKMIYGLPMIVHVYKRAEMCQDLDELYVATDSQRIREVVEEHGGKVIMTSKKPATGTDRIAEAVSEMECDLVVNIQGDEPLVRPEHISAAIRALEDHEVHVSCLSTSSTNKNDKNEIKVVFDKRSNVLYYSRTDIPSDKRVEVKTHYKQYCIYCFRKEFLKKFTEMEQSPLEKIEYVELLRAIENGFIVRNVNVDSNSKAVDTEEDLKEVEKLMKDDDLRGKY